MLTGLLVVLGGCATASSASSPLATAAPLAPIFSYPVVGVSVFGTIGDQSFQGRGDHEDPMRPETWGPAPVAPRAPVELHEVR